VLDHKSISLRISSEKVAHHLTKPELILPERLAEVPHDTLNGKVGEPTVSPLLDAPAPQKRFLLSPDRLYGCLRGDR
jgi:hypothetical protein